MKKIIFTISILFMLEKGTMAQDTLRICGCGSVAQLFSICSNPILSIHVFDGDTFNTLLFDITFCPGRQGIIDAYCQTTVTGIPDSSAYLIVAPLPKICVITSDSANHPVIYMDSSSLFGHSSLSLKRQVNTVTWQTIRTFLPGDTLVTVDVSVNTASQAYNYRIESNDFPCSDSAVTTLHLQSNGSNLIWNAGGGLGLRGYYIYKLNGGNFVLIDSTANRTYTDVNYQNGDEYYVGAYKDDGCQSNSWRSASPILVRSNKLKINASAINEPEQTLQRYYVEGTTLYVELKKADDVSLHDVTGRELMQRHTDKLDLQLQPGIYILNVGARGYKVLIH